MFFWVIKLNILAQIVGLVFGFLGALMLTLAEIMTRNEITAMSQTRWDENPDIKKNLQERSTLAIISTVFLFVGFGLQLFGTVY